MPSVLKKISVATAVTISGTPGDQLRLDIAARLGLTPVLAGQDMTPPMLANALVNFGDGLATLAFSAYQSFAPQEYLCCVGSKGTLRGTANVARITELELTTAKGTAKIPLKGMWFPDGFRGTLGEFLRSIEEGREPLISARNNLRSLELCFAALASADTGKPIKPGTVKTGRL